MTTTLIATPAGIAGRADEQAREIHRLKRVGDRLWPASGNYGEEAQIPTDLYSFDLTDPDAGMTHEYTATTQSTWSFAALSGGVTAVPFVDPLSYADPAQGALALRAADGSWSEVTSITDDPPIHVLGVLEHDGDVCVFAVSSDEPNGTPSCYRSSDLLTWVRESIAPQEPTDNARRPYSAAVVDGTLYVWVMSVAGDQGRYRRQVDGTWVLDDAGQLANDVIGTATLSGQQVLWLASDDRGQSRSAGATSWTPWSPTVSVSASGWPLTGYDLSIGEDGNVYWLAGQRLHRGHPNGAHEVLGDLDVSTARSLYADTARGVIYLGTSDSQFRSLSIP